MAIDPKDFDRVAAASLAEAKAHEDRFKDMPRQRIVAETPVEVNPMVRAESAPIEVEVETARKLASRTLEEMRRRMRPFARR